jgi:hypothetical protein
MLCFKKRVGTTRRISLPEPSPTLPHKTMHRTTAVFKLVVMTGTVFLTSCSLQGTPSESDAKQVLEEQLENWPHPWLGSFSLGDVRITSFKKTDGLASSENDVRKYRFDYAAKLEYPTGNNSFCLDSNPSPPAGKNVFICLLPTGNAQAKGAVQELEGSVEFVKSEAGWKAESITANCEPSHLSHKWCAK